MQQAILVPEVIPAVRTSVERQLHLLEKVRLRYRTRLKEMEQQHGFSSEEFAHRFQNGELGDDEVWFEWEYLLDIDREIGQTLMYLKQAQRSLDV